MNQETKNRFWIIGISILIAWILIQVTLWTSNESTFHGAVIVVGMLAFIAIIAGLGLVVVKTLLDTGGGVAISPTSFALAVGVPLAVAVLARSLNVPMGPTVSLSLISLGAMAIAINAPQAFPAIGRMVFAGMTVLVICSVLTKAGGDAVNNVVFPLAWETDRAVAVLLTALGATLWASGNVRRLSVAALTMLVLLFGEYGVNRAFDVMEAKFPAAIDTFADKTAFRFDRTTVMIEAPFVLVGADGKMTRLEDEQTAIAHFDANIPTEAASKFAGRVATFVVLVDKKTGMPISTALEGWVLKDKVRPSQTNHLERRPLTSVTYPSSIPEVNIDCNGTRIELAPNEKRCKFYKGYKLTPDDRPGWQFTLPSGVPITPDTKLQDTDWCIQAGPEGNQFCLERKQT